LEIMAIGGAAINREAELFLRQSGFPYLIGYGLTETAPLLAGGPWGDETIAVGSTGKPIAGVEIRIDDPDPRSGIGEIVARGANVMKGYYKDPEATRRVLDGEGWLRTGDLGNFDRAGNLCIRGRSKNMILMSNGENIYPEAIEDKINSCMHVVESLVRENGGLLEALVYLDYDLVDEETKGRSPQQKREHIDGLLLRLKETINPQLSSFAKIARFVEHAEPFQKTATSKIKRYLYTH
jgi:long-chain acyl-CoA synthetase